jgi:hypothetical protein
MYGTGSKSKRNYTYSSKTGTSSLRNHNDRWHLEAYLTAALERGWPILSPIIKRGLELGYSLSELKSLNEQGTDLTTLPPRMTRVSDPEGRRSIPQFSVAAFHKFLVEFIVADDQVSSHYMVVHGLCPHTGIECCRMPRV